MLALGFALACKLSFVFILRLNHLPATKRGEVCGGTGEAFVIFMDESRPQVIHHYLSVKFTPVNFFRHDSLMPPLSHSSDPPGVYFGVLNRLLASVLVLLED